MCRRNHARRVTRVLAPAWAPALAWVAALPLLAAWIGVRNSLQDAIFRVFSRALDATVAPCAARQ